MDCSISIVMANDGYGDYSIMVLVECGNQKRLFSRLLVEDYEEGIIHAFY